MNTLSYYVAQRTLYFYKFILISSLLPSISLLPFIPNQILGQNLTGYAWIASFLYSMVVILTSRKSAFKLHPWLPWIFYLLGYLYFDFSIPALQMTFQYLCYISIGVAAGCFIYNDFILFKLSKYLRNYFIFTFFYIMILLIRGTGIPALVMTLCWVSAIFLSIFYIYKKSNALIVYVVSLSFSIISLMRMGILMLLVLPFIHFANHKIIPKIVAGSFAIIGVIMIFNLPSVQRKMFYSGEGKLSEMSFENVDFNSSGRITFTKLIEEGIKAKPIFGNGPRSDLRLFIANDLGIKEAHNDYLDLRYNYGWIGFLLFFLGFSSQFLMIWKSKFSFISRPNKVLYYSCLTIFLPVFGFMYTDNILRYDIYYGNFLFALCGILFSIARQQKINIRELPSSD